MAKATPTFEGDPREGITTKTTKAEMLERLNKLAEMLEGTQKKERSKLAKLERDLQKKWKNRFQDDNLLTVLLSASQEEWDTTKEFLTDAEPLLPASLKRLLVGLNYGWGNGEDDVV